MKKKLSLVLSFLFLIFTISSFSVTATNITSSDYASYKENQLIEEHNLDNGIYHRKTTAISTANRCINPYEGKKENLIDSPQQVNLVTVPSSVDARIVNYTFPNATGWTRATLSTLVEMYEASNPGWTVIAGVNGDFYDWHALDKALPYHTTGSTMENGDFLRTVSTKSVGYKNDGSSNSFVMAANTTFTEEEYLEIFDDNGNVIKDIRIDKLNEEPTDNEIALYCTYKKNLDLDPNEVGYEGTETVTAITPAENSYIVNRPERCLPTEKDGIFAKGRINEIDKEFTLLFGHFAIVTNNQEVKELLDKYPIIRIQRKATGVFSDCDQIIGVGSTLVENGIVSENDSDGMRDERHPRTCIGIKDDGSLMLMVVDGRQQTHNMYGMTEDELGVMMKHYGCYNGVNIDGGGSTTLGIRTSDGKFTIMNSPCEINQRPNGNAVLVVVPRMNLKYANIADTTVNLKYDENKEFTISNLSVKLNDEIIEMNSNNKKIENLIPETEYEIKYSYDITYKGVTRTKQGEYQKFKTGKIGPKIIQLTFDITNSLLKLKYNIQDINNLIIAGTIKHGTKSEFLYEYSNGYIELLLDEVDTLDISINLDYNVQSDPNRNAIIIEDFKWYPTSINLNNYYEEEQQIINEIIDNINNSIKLASKEELIDKIATAKANIASTLNKTQKDLQIAKENAIITIQNICKEENYRQEEWNTITSMISNAISAIENSSKIEEISPIINNITMNLSLVKTDKEYYEEELIVLKDESISTINEYINNKKYNSNNQKLVEEIINNATADIENAKTKEDIKQLFDNAISEIDEIKQKGCKSNAILIYSLFINLIVVSFIVLKKKH